MSNEEVNIPGEVRDEVVDPHAEMLAAEQDNFFLIQRSLTRIIVAKSQNNSLEGWGGSLDGRHSDDGKIHEKNDEIIMNETSFVRSAIDRQFDLFRAEIEESETLRSPSGKDVKSKDVVDIISELRIQAITGKTPDYTFITRANNLRDRVSAFLEILVKLKKISS
jgi:hypothetical protein